MRESLQIVVSAVVGGLTAYLVSLTLGTAYREGEVLSALIPLLFVPGAMFVLYEGTEKRTLSCLLALLLTAGFLQGSWALGIEWNGVGLLLASVAAVALPLGIDLASIDLGKRIRIGRPIASVMTAVFAVSLLPLSAWTLVSTHHAILEEDAKIVDEVVAKMTPWEDYLIVDKLDPKLREQAQRRLVVRSSGKTYDLSDAAVESVVEERTVRKQTRQRGNKSESVNKQQEERMRLILKLQGTAIPDDVVVYSRRGPLTIYEAKARLLEPSVAQ